MNKKGQLDFPVIGLFVVIIGLLLLAPIMLKIFISIQTPMANSLGNISSGGTIAKNNFNSVMNTAINLWDKVIIAAFAFAIILMFVSAFFIDAHPFFIVLYIMIAFMLVIFAPNIMEAIDNIYESADFATEVGMLSFMDSLRVHYAEFLVGLIIVTCIIIYGKYAFLRGR